MSDNYNVHPDDLKITVKSKDRTGFGVAKLDTCVRVKHKPTGLMAQSDISRNQHRNKYIAVKMLETAIIAGMATGIIPKQRSSHDD